MRNGIGVVLILLLSAAPAAAQKMKVYVDYDRTVDLDSYETFAWGPTLNMGPDLNDTAPLAHAWIKNAVEYHLTQGGLIEDEEHPQLYVTYYSDESSAIQIQVVAAGYTYGPGFYWDPFWGYSGSASVQRREIPRGSLVIDIWDAETKRLVWRGTASATVSESPTKMTKQIDKAVDKIAKKFQKMRVREGK
jgi:hypothetical protein